MIIYLPCQEIFYVFVSGCYRMQVMLAIGKKKEKLLLKMLQEQIGREIRNFRKDGVNWLKIVRVKGVSEFGG